MKAAAVLLCFCTGLGAQPASIEGTTVNAQTGEPLGGVHVRLFTGSFNAISTVYGAISDTAGHYSINAMEPGSYFVMLEHRGFLTSVKSGPMPSSSVTLKPGQHLAGYKLEMIPRAAILGRVVDEYGDPVRYVQVQAEALAKDAPPASGFGPMGSSTDERGEFRMSLLPGKYRLKATPTRLAGQDEIRTDGTSGAPFGPTYYPSAASADRAAAVEAVAGADVNGIDIHLLRQRGGFSVSGSVSGMSDSCSNATVTLQSFEGSFVFMRGSQGRGIQSDGKFSFRNLEPHLYRIYAQCPSGKTAMQSQIFELRPEGGDVSNLELVLAPGGEMAGTLEIVGPGGKAVSVEKHTVRLEPTQGFYGNAPAGEVEKGGGFRIANVLPGKFRVRVDPLPENAYLKTVLLDGAPAVGEILDLSHGVHGSRLKMTASLAGAQLTGAARDPEGALLANTLAMVFLLSNPSETAFEHMSRVTPEGKYSFKGVRPGKYRLFALDLFHSRLDRSEEAMKKFFAAAEEIEIKEGDRIVRDVKVVPKGDREGDAKSKR